MRRFLVRLLKKYLKISALKLTIELKNSGTAVSVNTVQNECTKQDFYCRITRGKFPVIKKNRKMGLCFANKCLNKSPDFWKDIIFTDKSKLNIYGSERETNCTDKTQYINVYKEFFAIVKHGGEVCLFRVVRVLPERIN